MQEKELKRGKIIVCSIAAAEILCAVFSTVANFNLQQLILGIISIVLAICLLGGYNWVKNLYATIASFNIILGLAAVMVVFDASEALLWQQILFFGGWILFIAINAAVAGLLFFSRSVKEYLYFKRNG